ncbi:alkaline phosphatase D family protein [Shimia sp. MMG029]|uniref:alkaline phosphatase D family protein n=1 Tax=Shimia sp. MMG029 TaxID=3021978 RepID=UPI0022FDD279|nr:alkaline phosphatase D family protein [Shimia sp. MMG029]MDA5559004.1 alkaline phosphatase D family protein [Shimia sp. MMG029]
MGDTRFTRRQAIVALLGTSALAVGGGLWAFSAPSTQTFKASETIADAPFAHGVASGDPLQDRVVIWTRLDPESVPGETAEVAWEMWDAEDTSAVWRGVFATNAERDWTVKVDVAGLVPGRKYVYQFLFGTYVSKQGMTCTLPAGRVDQARFAVVSCSNWQFGYFNAYDHIARSGHFDAMIHLGDYIYEYGQSEKSGKPKDGAIRLHDPAHEIITLDDYRKRMAQYRSDPSLQRVTSVMPLIAIWDDHETANDSFVAGADNHQPEEGAWLVRRDAALQAYFEWLPVREPATGQSRTDQFRAFEWGDLATIVALESRLVGRQAPIIIDDYFEMLYGENGAEQFNKVLNDPARDMLGQAQRDFVAQTFGASKSAGKPWRLLANQVVMGRVQTPDLNPHVTQEAIDRIRPLWSGIDNFVKLSGFRLPFDTDRWDGYPAARKRLYDQLADVGVRDMLVVTGDAHEYWLNDLTDDAGAKMGVEIGTTSVTSGTLKGFLGSATESYALLMTRENEDVRYYNPLYNGYVDLTLTPREAITRCVAIDTVRTTSYGAFEGARFTIRHDAESLKFVRPSGLNVKQYSLFRGWA